MGQCHMIIIVCGRHLVVELGQPRGAAGGAKPKRREAEESEILQRRGVATSHQCPSLPHDVAVAAILDRRVPRRHISAVQGSGRRKLPSSRAAAMELMVARAGVQAAPEEAAGLARGLAAAATEAAAVVVAQRR